MTHFDLKYYLDFKKVLAGYHISERAKNTLDSLDMVLVVAPTSVGKNTLIKELLKTGKYYFIVSDTTRPPQFRDGRMERNGVEYFFRSEEEMLEDLKMGEFLEAAVIHEQQVSGISIRELENAKAMNKIAVTDIDIVGAENVKRENPNVKIIFLVPPSFEEWQRRIAGKTKMSQQEISNRMTEAKRGIFHALDTNHYDFIIAEDLSVSVKIIDDLIHGKADPHQERAKEILKDIQKKLGEI